MVELAGEESLQTVMEKYAGMSNWISIGDRVLSVYYSVMDPYFFKL